MPKGLCSFALVDPHWWRRGGARWPCAQFSIWERRRDASGHFSFASTWQLAQATWKHGTRSKLWENVCEFYEKYSTAWWSDIFCFQPNLGWLCVVLRLYFNCSNFLQGKPAAWAELRRRMDLILSRREHLPLVLLNWTGSGLFLRELHRLASYKGAPMESGSFFLNCDCLLKNYLHILHSCTK